MRSVLPGCIFSIALTRVYMLRPMSALVAQHRQVQQTLYVDDSGQYTSGKSPRQVGRTFAAAAVGFVRMAHTLKLTLSVGDMGKTIMVTNHKLVASTVLLHLSYQRASINIGTTATYLGALLVGGAGINSLNH